DVDGCPAVCCFNNSLRNPVSRLVLCAYKIDNTKVSVKKMPVSQAVNFTSTFVVCAPKIFSVTPPPKAAPKPSLFGRCIKMTSTIKSATRTYIASRKFIRICIGDVEYGQSRRRSNRSSLLDLVPNLVQLGKI